MCQTFFKRFFTVATNAVYLGSVDNAEVLVLVHQLVHANSQPVNGDIVLDDVTNKIVLQSNIKTYR
jgi:hypothetical protein